MRPDAGLVEIIPEGNTLPAEQDFSWLVTEWPEIQLNFVVVYFPVTLAWNWFCGGIKGGVLVLGIAMDEVKDAVRSGSCAGDEV